MIFDFEPQRDHPHFDTVRRMIVYFNDSTNQGKLFINYPMMQSYKHFDKLPCSNFENLEIPLEQVKNYKEIVEKISGYTDLDKYNYIIYYSIACQLKKVNKIINGTYELLNEKEYLQIDFFKIYEYQINLLEKRKVTSVLNTCIFALIDFAPEKFFKFVASHKDELLI